MRDRCLNSSWFGAGPSRRSRLDGGSAVDCDRRRHGSNRHARSLPEFKLGKLVGHCSVRSFHLLSGSMRFHESFEVFVGRVQLPRKIFRPPERLEPESVIPRSSQARDVTLRALLDRHGGLIAGEE